MPQTLTVPWWADGNSQHDGCSKLNCLHRQEDGSDRFCAHYVAVRLPGCRRLSCGIWPVAALANYNSMQCHERCGHAVMRELCGKLPQTLCGKLPPKHGGKLPRKQYGELPQSCVVGYSMYNPCCVLTVPFAISKCKVSKW